MKKKPNIIICTCDQLRAFALGCYGNKVIQTPNIDSLAAEGVRFETAVSNYPVCMAARSVLLSGQYNRKCTGGVANINYPGEHGVRYYPQYPVHGRPHLKDLTLVEILRNSGYHTVAIGKWHIHSWPQDIGFAYYLIPRMNHCHSAQSFSENGKTEFVPEGYSVDFEAGKVEDFICKRQNNEKPFFMYYNISPPHCPLSDAPEKYLKMYNPADLPLRPNVDLRKKIKNQEHEFKIYRWDFRYYNHRLPYTMNLPEEYDLRQVIAEYYGLTTWADAAVGRMLKALEKSGLRENTIIVFTSDHGDCLGSHGYVQKGQMVEEGIRIPLIVKWAQSAKPEVVDKQVAGLVDIMPTLLSLTGNTIPQHVQGKDLSPLIFATGDTLTEPHSFIESGYGLSVRTPSHMCFIPFVKPGAGKENKLMDLPEQFFNLVNDPYELNNLAGSQEEAGIAAGLCDLIRQWDRKTEWMQT